MPHAGKVFVILAVACFSVSAVAAIRLAGTTASNGFTSHVSAEATLCTLEQHFRYRGASKPFRLDAQISPLRICL
jgi:hypothetical protein